MKDVIPQGRSLLAESSGALIYCPRVGSANDVAGRAAVTQWTRNFQVFAEDMKERRFNMNTRCGMRSMGNREIIIISRRRESSAVASGS